MSEDFRRGILIAESTITELEVLSPDGQSIEQCINEILSQYVKRQRQQSKRRPKTPAHLPNTFKSKKPVR